MSLVDQLRDVIQELFTSFISNTGLVTFLTTIVMIIFWVLLFFIINKITSSLIMRTRKAEAKFGKKTTQEQLTVNRLMKNIVTFFFSFWILIMILGELGIDLVPLLAGAGVFAFAVGFGAQELIKDVIAGVFLIIEKTFKIGDFVEIGTVSGTITDVGLRRIKIVNPVGEVITINNGDIRIIKNSSINPSMALVEFRVPFTFDLHELDTIEFKTMMIEFKDKNKDVLEMPDKLVVLEMNDAIKLRAAIKTKTRKHIAIERAFRAELIKYFTEHNLQIIVPVVVKEDRVR